VHARDIYLLIGQSNMAGRAPFTTEEAVAIPRCYLLNNEDVWEPARNPLNRYSSVRKGLGSQKMNPGYGFVKAILEKNKDISIGLVVNAKGGTAIEEWKKGTDFYKEALRRVVMAQKSGTLKGILWHQGEGNSKNPEGYLDKLKTLIVDLRKDLGIADLPFIAGQINNVEVGAIAINDQIAMLPGTVKATGYASSEGLTTMDRWHFNAESMKLLGERYAEEMLKVQVEQQRILQDINPNIMSLPTNKVTVSDTEKTWQLGEPIVTYWAGPAPMTDFAAKQLAEGGWNLVRVSPRGQEDGVSVVDHFVSQLDILQRHGLRGIIGLGKYLSRDEKAPQMVDNPKLKEEFDTIIDGVKSHPALYAYTFRDEPATRLFKNIARIKEYTEARDPAHLVYINLYPMNISGKRLGVDGERGLEAGRQYLQQFIDICKPKMMSYDHYNFGVRGDGVDYFLNLKMMREASLKANIPFLNIVQACSWTVNVRIPTGEEMRWLVYTTLAYGAQGISYYIYSHTGHDGGMAEYDYEKFKKDGVRAIGKPTPLYYYMCKLNREFVAIAKELQPLKSLAVYHVGIIPKGGTALPEDSPFQFNPPVLQEAFPLESVEKLTKAELAARFAQGGETGTRLKGFVLGLFGKDETPTYALVVNLDYRTWSGIGHKRRDEFINPIRRALVGPGRLEFFDPDTSQWKDAEKSYVVLRLPPGGGLLVRVAEKH